MINKKGFTLIEMILVLSISVILMAGIYTILKPMMSTIGLNRDLESYKQTANVIQNLVTEKLKFMKEIMINSTDSKKYSVPEVGGFNQFLLMQELGASGEGYLATADVVDRKPGNIQLLLPKEFYKGLKTKVIYTWNVNNYKLIQLEIELYDLKGKKVYSAHTAVECLNMTDIYYAKRFDDIYIAISK